MRNIYSNFCFKGEDKSSNLLESLKIQHDFNHAHAFPNKFSINLTDIETNEFNVVSFVKISRSDSEHPISTSDIYTGFSNDFIKVSDSRHVILYLYLT